MRALAAVFALGLGLAAGAPASGQGTQDPLPPSQEAGEAEPTLDAQAPEPSQELEGAPLVERIEIRGNQFVQKETLLFYVSTKPGDRYDERRLREDFRRLWDTGFLEDLSVESYPGSNGMVVVFALSERKRIQIVDFRGSKALTTTAIEDKLKEKDAQLRIDSFYTIGKARRAEAIIREMLEEKGRRFGSVKHDAKTVGGAGMQVSFIIDDGPKSFIKEIRFSGNEVFSDGKLRGRMKKLKQRGFWNFSWITGASTYTDEKWEGGPRDDGDRARLQEHYLNTGHVTATVGEPKVSWSDGKSGFLRKKPVKWMHLEVPLTEGDQYRVGDVKFEGMTVFDPELVRPLFKLQTGDVYKESRIKKGFEKLRDAYGAQGYFQFTPSVDRNHDALRKVVDVVLKMEEDKRYFVGRIDFTGNDSTRDKVIRREVYLTEGDVFNTELLKLSIRRINQLGYFKPMESAPQLGQSAQGDDRLDVTFKVEEQNRNQFTFGGGVSGLEGTFINASFSTANFLGLGETFQVSAQSGRRTKNYQIAITEPYFLDRPITAGVDLYKRRLEYQTFAGQNIQGYIDDRLGISFVTGLRLGRWYQVFGNYAYEIVEILESENASLTDPTRPPTVNPIFLDDVGKRRESRLTPSIIFNSVDNPWTPRSGGKLAATLQLAGGPLGGTLSYVKPNLEAIWYIPHWRRTALGLRAEIAYLRPFGETAEVFPETGQNGLPFYLRYYLGGETQIRGYEIRSVGPRDKNNNLLGGNKFVLFNAEYYIDIAGPLRGVFFFDAGQAYLEGQRIDLSQLKTSTGFELRFIMPVLNVPFRLIYAINPNADPALLQPRSTFKFAVGTTF